MADADARGVRMGGGLQADLDAALADRRLARVDAGGALARDLDAGAGVSLPSFAEVERALATADPGAGAMRDIEALLSLDGAGALLDDGGRLNRLLDGGAIGPAERAVVTNGLVFLRAQRFREAEEWWALNRPADSASPFALLLRVMAVLTLRLAGQEARAAAAHAALKDELRRHLR